VYNRYLSNCPDVAVLKRAEAIAQQQRLGVMLRKLSPGAK
jgi:hypothetical protein